MPSSATDRSPHTSPEAWFVTSWQLVVRVQNTERLATWRQRCDDALVDDADTAQARILLAALWAQVDETSSKLEAAERRLARTRSDIGTHHRRDAADLRHELYHAHRLIDGLHRRFPTVRVTSATC
jgi:hypothetical protein